MTDPIKGRKDFIELGDQFNAANALGNPREANEVREHNGDFIMNFGCHRTFLDELPDRSFWKDQAQQTVRCIRLLRCDHTAQKVSNPHTP